MCHRCLARVDSWCPGHEDPLRLQGDREVPLPSLPGDLGLNRPTRAGLESFRELVMGIRQAAAHDTPAAALSRAIAQVCHNMYNNQGQLTGAAAAHLDLLLVGAAAYLPSVRSSTSSYRSFRVLSCGSFK